MKDAHDALLRQSDLLDVVIAEYLACKDTGSTVDRDEFLSRHPDLADGLRKYFADQDAFEAQVPRQSLTDPFPVPHHLGRIELRTVIGRGAFGTVYKGWDVGMERWVAVKALRVPAGSPPDAIDQALREAKVTAQLTHAGVVEAYDVGESAGVPYAVSEFIDGPTLAELIADDRPPTRDAVGWIAAVADTLHHAHEQKVVHRDVKPSNILMRDGRMPVLTDFGLALWHTGDETRTADGRVVGTLAYMSPEQARGRAQVDRRSDVYSLGVILYELLTGERPFVGTAQGMLYQIQYDEPRPPKRLDDRVPRDLDTVCLRCLQKEPSRRYATAAEVAADLRRYLAGEPVHARPVGRVERLVRWGRKNPGLATAGALVAVLITATVWVSVRWALDSEKSAKDIQSALDESRRVRAETEFDRGLAEAERGDVGLGMLWMARSLETAPDGSDREWAVRVNLEAWRRQLVTLTDCKDPPPGRVLAFAPDGKTAWFVEPDERTVRCWDLVSGRVVGHPLEHPGGGVHCVAVSPDGQRIACGSRGSGASAWQVASGKREASLSDRQVRGLAYSADGRELFLGLGTKSGTAFWWWGGAEPRQVAGATVETDWLAVAAMPDGRSLLTASQEDVQLRRRDVTTGELRNLLRYPSPIRVLAVSPDGQRVLTGGDDRSARLWNLATGQLLGVLHHRAPVTSVAFGPGGKTLLTASLNDAIRVWTAPPEDEALSCVSLPGKVRAAAVSPDGLIATGSDDALVRLWRVTDGRLSDTGHALTHPQPIRSVNFSPDGRTLAVVPFIAHGVHLWNPSTGERTGMLAHPWTVRQVCPSPDGKRVATVAYDRSVRMWDWSGRPTVPHVFAAEHLVCAVAFRPDGRELVAADRNGGVHRWDVASGTQLGGINAHGGAVGSIRFLLPNAKTLMTADDTGVAQLWDAGALAPTGPTLRHEFAIAETAASPDGRIVLTGGQDGKTRVWDAGTGQEAARPLRHGGQVRAVAISPSGRWVVTASADGTARVWALRSGRSIGSPVYHGRSAWCAVVDPNDRWILTGGEDATVRLLSAPSEHRGEPGRIAESVQVATGAEVNDVGDLRPLSLSEWCLRSARAAGPP